MRTYNRRFINSKIHNVSDQSLELRSGIIWSIDSTAHTCGVKLLGSTDIITAYYPPSWSVLPNWVQSGSPVCMRHRSGFRNTLEIIGPGNIIPTPSTGDYSPTPDSSLLPDRILSGCKLSEIPLEPQMGILVGTGEIRIGGATISVDAIKMDSTYYKMDMGGKINDVAAAIEINSAPTDIRNIRYDLFVAGTDGIVDYLPGTTFQTTAATATIPALTTDHIELGRVLVPAGKTIIYNNDFDVPWSPVTAKAIIITADTTDLSAVETTAAVTVKIADRFLNGLAKNSGYGWNIELEIANGTGSISSTAGSSTSVISAYAGSTVSEYTFTYTRAGTAVDISPILTARLKGSNLNANFSILLRDDAGNIMTS